MNKKEMAERKALRSKLRALNAAYKMQSAACARQMDMLNSRDREAASMADEIERLKAILAEKGVVELPPTALDTLARGTVDPRPSADRNRLWQEYRG